MTTQSQSSRAILDKIKEFEQKFSVVKSDFAPGLPNRKALYRAARADAMARSLLPENLAIRNELYRQLRRARRSEAARRVALWPDHTERQKIFRALRNLGFTRINASGRSAYYRRESFTVRVSDHHVPLTSARAEALADGARTWADSEWSYVVGGEVAADEWLAAVRAVIERGDT